MSLPLNLAQIAQLLDCETSFDAVDVTGTAIDSRKVKTGHLFVALPGQHVDGHQYLGQAREAGAIAALVSEYQDDALPQLKVTNVVEAFGKIAAFWRQQSSAKVIAVTGSNGKTTLKEMIAAMLSKQGHVLATQGNLNNELGVPLTLTRLRAGHGFAVIEMGANHPGEIERLVAITRPDVAVINNVAAAHLEGFGTLEGVARAKGEIFNGLKLDGKGVINADMPYGELWDESLKGHQVISFGLENAADIRALDLQLTATGSHFMVSLEGINHFFSLPLPGKHNVANALAAIAVCRALEIEPEAMVKGLGSIKSVPHRLQLRSAINHSLLLDDTYNANPGSFQQALGSLKNFPGHHWLVLGDFGELGADSEAIHQQMGRDAKQAGVEKLFTVGKQSQFAANEFGDKALHFENVKQLQQHLQLNLTAEVVCLLKGSRFMQLDKLADALVIQGES